MGSHRNKDDATTDCFNVTGVGIALTESESVPRASDSSRGSADAAAWHCVSLNRHRLASNALGRPRSASARRSRRMRATAVARLFRGAAFVRPSPFAPGTSGQYATNHLPSRSLIAVNSFRMTPSYRGTAPAAVAV